MLPLRQRSGCQGGLKEGLVRPPPHPLPCPPNNGAKMKSDGQGGGGGGVGQGAAPRESEALMDITSCHAGRGARPLDLTRLQSMTLISPQGSKVTGPHRSRNVPDAASQSGSPRRINDASVRHVYITAIYKAENRSLYRIFYPRRKGRAPNFHYMPEGQGLVQCLPAAKQRLHGHFIFNAGYFSVGNNTFEG